MSKQRSQALLLYPMLFIALLCLTGCTTYVNVRSAVPASFNYGASRNLVLVHATGRKIYREELITELNTQLKGSAWWLFEDKRDSGIEIKIGKNTARISPANKGPNSVQVYIRIDFHSLNVKSKEIIQEVEKDGKVQKERYIRYKAKAIFSVTTLDGKGRMLMGEREYIGLATERGSKDDKLTAQKKAIQNGVSALLSDITPTFKNDKVAVDDKQEDQKQIVKMISNGKYPEAAKALRKFLLRAPNRPDLHYNLAVVTEAMGDYPTALKHYDIAVKYGKKGFYQTSRDKCAQRMKNNKAVKE